MTYAKFTLVYNFLISFKILSTASPFKKDMISLLGANFLKVSPNEVWRSESGRNHELCFIVYMLCLFKIPVGNIPPFLLTQITENNGRFDANLATFIIKKLKSMIIHIRDIKLM